MHHRIAVSILLAGFLAADASRAQVPANHGSAPSISPDGSKIAFLSERDGATDIFVVGANGAGEVRLTRTPEEESQPGWSSDGKRLWFTVFADGASRVYSIGLDGKDRKLFGTVPGRALRLSPDGRTILYWTGTWAAMKMFASNLDGSGATQLTDGSGVVWGARWSPDGREIAFADKDPGGNLQIFAIHADGSGRRQVSRPEPADLREQMPAWSPDGAQLAVQAGTKNEPAHIWIVDVATGQGRKLAAHAEPYQDEVPAWFPDGKRIAFQSDRTGRMEIWVMNADGSQPRQVTK
jgi:TolB protein